MEVGPHKAKNPDQYTCGITNQNGQGKGGRRNTQQAELTAPPTETPGHIPISLIGDHTWIHIIAHARGGPQARIGDERLGWGKGEGRPQPGQEEGAA